MSTGVKKEAPLCECGCGKPVKWNKNYRRWNERIQYHSTGVHINATNTDIESYIFTDLDLEQAVNSLDERDRRVVILILMGLTHAEIASLVGLTRSSITKIYDHITDVCASLLCETP